MSEDVDKSQPSPSQDAAEDKEPTLAQRRMEIYR